MIYTWYLQADFPNILISVYPEMGSRWAPMIFPEAEAKTDNPGLLWIIFLVCFKD